MQAQKTNYQRQLEEILAQLEAEKTAGDSPRKPTLLLHACCAPCSSHVIEYLAQIFDITIFYYNPNIHPREEYERRLEELRRFLPRFPKAVQNDVKLVADEYNPEDYFEATNVRSEVELQTEPEKGERCRRCYRFRMRRAFAYAAEHGFDWLTTTLSISPHKDSEKINAIGRELEQQFLPEKKSAEIKAETTAHNQTNGSPFDSHTKFTRFLPADFKKKGGFLRSTQLSEEYGLWRQDYCGCVYSMRKN